MLLAPAGEALGNPWDVPAGFLEVPGVVLERLVKTTILMERSWSLQRRGPRSPQIFVGGRLVEHFENMLKANVISVFVGFP